MPGTCAATFDELGIAKLVSDSVKRHQASETMNPTLQIRAVKRLVRVNCASAPRRRPQLRGIAPQEQPQSRQEHLDRYDRQDHAHQPLALDEAPYRRRQVARGADRVIVEHAA